MSFLEGVLGLSILGYRRSISVHGSPQMLLTEHYQGQFDIKWTRPPCYNIYLFNMKLHPQLTKLDIKLGTEAKEFIMLKG